MAIARSTPAALPLLALAACTSIAQALTVRTATKDSVAYDVKTTVWIHGFARSGSSTMMSMVTEAGLEGGPNGRAAARRRSELARVNATATAIKTREEGAANAPLVDNVFALFEPCDRRDKLAPELEALPYEERCAKLMPGLSNCSFEKVDAFHNWQNDHNKLRGAGKDVYVKEKAHAACKSADFVAYKTVTRAFESFRLPAHAIPALDADPSLLLIDMVRDPRSIFASWMSTWPFNDTNLPAGVRRNVTALTGICDSIAAGMDVEHPRLKRVVFEHMISRPTQVTRQVGSFLHSPFGTAERNWIARTFNARECPGVTMYIAAYSDCHTDSKVSIAKWRGVLTNEEKQAFLHYPPCRAVAQRFNYTLS